MSFGVLSPVCNTGERCEKVQGGDTASVTPDSPGRSTSPRDGCTIFIWRGAHDMEAVGDRDTVVCDDHPIAPVTMETVLDLSWGSGFQSKGVEAHTGFEPVPPP